MAIINNEIIISGVKIPFYVFMLNSASPYKVALRLLSDNKTYYRDGGMWSVGFRIKDGKLLSSNKYGKDKQFLGGKELIECSFKEWQDNNRQYSEGIEERTQAKVIKE